MPKCKFCNFHPASFGCNCQPLSLTDCSRRARILFKTVLTTLRQAGMKRRHPYRQSSASISLVLTQRPIKPYRVLSVRSLASGSATVGFSIHVRDHAARRFFKQARDNRMHQGRAACQYKSHSKTACEYRVFAIAFINSARVRKKNPCQHEALPFLGTILSSFSSYLLPKYS